MVSGPLAVEDIELVIPSKKSLEAGSLVGDPGARERGAGVKKWGENSHRLTDWLIYINFFATDLYDQTF